MAVQGPGMAVVVEAALMRRVLLLPVWRWREEGALAAAASLSTAAVARSRDRAASAKRACGAMGQSRRRADTGSSRRREQEAGDWRGERRGEGCGDWRGRDVGREIRLVKLPRDWSEVKAVGNFRAREPGESRVDDLLR